MARLAIIHAIVAAVICVGGIALGKSADKPQRRPTSIQGAFDAQEDRIKTQGIAICVFIVGIGFGCYAVKQGRKAQRLIEEHDAGRRSKGTAVAGTNVGWVAIAANAAFILVIGL